MVPQYNFILPMIYYSQLYRMPVPPGGSNLIRRHLDISTHPPVKGGTGQ